MASTSSAHEPLLCKSTVEQGVSLLRLDFQKKEPIILFKEVADFFKKHPQWVKILPKMICRLQKAVERQLPYPITSACDAEKVCLFFAKHKPLTPEGWRLYIQGQKKAILQDLRTYWHKAPLSAADEDKMLRWFAKYLRPADHIKRLEHRLFKDQHAEAKTLLEKLPFAKDKTIAAKIANISVALSQKDALTKNPHAETNYKNLPSTLQQLPILAYSYIRFLIRNQRAPEVFLLWQKVRHRFPSDSALYIKVARELWEEGRKAQESGASKEAVERYFKKALHALCETPPIAPSEKGWEEKNLLAGIILLEGLKKPKEALACFTTVLWPHKMGGDCVSPTKKHYVSRLHTKAAYWAGRCHEALKDRENAKALYERAAQRPHFFYGLLAQEKLGQPITVAFIKPVAAQKTQHSECTQLLLSIAQELQRQEETCADKGNTALLFLEDLLPHLSNDEERLLFLNVFKAWCPVVTPYCAKVFGFSSEKPFKEDYPIIPLPCDLGRPSLIHAFICIESSFNPDTHGGADERGLMQVWPKSAELAAAQLKVPYILKKLWEPAYNILIGTQELKRALFRFDNHYIPTICAYNTGITGTRRWVKAFPKPRTLEEAVLWIEGIPYLSVRDYVQNVLAACMVYRTIIDGPLSSESVRKMFSMPRS